MARQSKAERELINFSREAFGDHLGGLLLCGYGEGGVLSSRDFAVGLADEDGAAAQLRLMFVAEGPAAAAPSLPRGKEALVLLALLRLHFNGDGGPAQRLTYTSGQVLDLLGWGAAAGTREIVTNSLTKYFHSFYQLRGDPRGQGHGARRDFTLKLRPFAEHRSRHEGGATGDDAGDVVTFSPNYIRQLMQGSLLGIDWSRVKSLTPLPVEFFNL